METQLTFKEEIKEVLIPVLEGMLEKEEVHLEFLKKHKDQLSAGVFIEYSYIMVGHLMDRIEQYKEYVECRL